MKQEYRHTKPIRGKDPSFAKEWESDIKSFSFEDYQKAVTNDFTDYLQHCKTNYLSSHNDGYTREFYRGELLRLKSILNGLISETEDILNGENNK
tara:strand:- start:481 stop:765 length:285 start_codon:yes stop_codon:yes gene_type:complete